MDLPVTSVVLVVLAAVGIIDVGWYHLWSLRLYREHQARYEQIAHLCRGALFVAMLCLIAPMTPRGRWVDVGLCIFAADAVNTMTDTWLERKSRPRGLGHGEYMVHVAGSVLSGALAFAFAFETWPLRAEPTALVPRAHPAGAVWLAWLGVAVVAAVVLLEAGLHVHARMTTLRRAPEAA